MTKEFSHLEVRLVRNSRWLRQFEKRGFYLSESFPVAVFELPKVFENMSEKDLDVFRDFIIAKLGCLSENGR